jgi:ElaB/YqjD/DUF883 family membrane-anchored ribosome-binding protein
MKQNSERTPEGAMRRIPLVVVEGRKMLSRSARKAGVTAANVARQGRQIVGRSVDRTERYARTHPWTGLGAAACLGACVGAVLAIFYFRD